MTFPNEIEKTKAEIKVLEAKLSFLEELQNHKTLCEEAYKKVYGNYPDTGIGNGHSYIWWDVFKKGYNAAKEEKVSEYPYKKYTPEETEKSLKDAMKTAKQNGVFDEQEPETLTLKNLLKKWEVNFSAKWKNPKNKTSELYEEEVERFIQMFEEWMPDVIRDVQDDWDDGYNSYRNTLMRKLK
jgi:molecular chaperone DnaK (HSP70)